MFNLTRRYISVVKKTTLIHPEYADLSRPDLNRYLFNVCNPAIIVRKRKCVQLSRDQMWYNVGRRITFAIVGYVFGGLVIYVLYFRFLYKLFTHQF